LKGLSAKILCSFTFPFVQFTRWWPDGIISTLSHYARPLSLFTSSILARIISLRTAPLAPDQEAMKTYGGVDLEIHVFSTSALAGGEWSASRPGRYTPVERARCTHWIGGWVGPKSGRDDMEK
jgi:hypothetical protein